MSFLYRQCEAFFAVSSNEFRYEFMYMKNTVKSYLKSGDTKFPDDVEILEYFNLYIPQRGPQAVLFYISRILTLCSQGCIYNIKCIYNRSGRSQRSRCTLASNLLVGIRKEYLSSCSFLFDRN